MLQFFPLIHWFFSLSSFVIPSKCLKIFICAASKRCSSLFFSTQPSFPNFSASLAVMLWILNLYITDISASIYEVQNNYTAGNKYETWDSGLTRCRWVRVYRVPKTLCPFEGLTISHPVSMASHTGRPESTPPPWDLQVSKFIHSNAHIKQMQSK